jgi:glycosyltransferase involved in cell wall biosynthesis
MQPTPRTIAVIPAFNEAATIHDLAQRVLAQLSGLIVVDDGSVDDTGGRLAGFPVQVIRHPENRGKAASLWTGMQAGLQSGATAIITLDGDGQHAPEDIPRLLQAHREHPDDIIIGARLQNRKEAPAARRFANGFADFWISWAAGLRIRDSQSGLRLYPAELLARIDVPYDKAHGFVFESEVLIEAVRLGYGCHAIPIKSCYPTQARKSHFRPLADIGAIMRMVAGKLLAQGMNPAGLWRILLDRH